jgi:serine/threonine-protein kinase
MDFLEGASFADLLGLEAEAERRLPPAVVVRIVLDACAGLHAAHELRDEKGRPVGLVHRDVSPQNILVGVDRTARVSDFGIAKITAAGATASGALKGKLAYMAPEYIRSQRIDRRADVFGLGVVLWEALVGKRLFKGENEVETIQRVLTSEAPAPSKTIPEFAPLDDVLGSALAKHPDERFTSARAMAFALESSAQRAGQIASHTEVAALVLELAGAAVEARRAMIREKLAQEPSVLSLLDAPMPSLPAAAAAKTLASPGVPSEAEAPRSSTAPPTVPERPDTRPETSSPAGEATADSAFSAAGVPREGSGWKVLGIAVGVGIVVGAGVMIAARASLHTDAAPSAAIGASVPTAETHLQEPASSTPAMSAAAASATAAPPVDLAAVSATPHAHPRGPPHPRSTSSLSLGPPPSGRSGPGSAR